MVTLKAIRNTWDNKHKGSHVNLSHMEHFYIHYPLYFSNCVNCPTPPRPHLALDYKHIYQT